MLLRACLCRRASTPSVLSRCGGSGEGVGSTRAGGHGGAAEGAEGHGAGGGRARAAGAAGGCPGGGEEPGAGERSPGAGERSPGAGEGRVREDGEEELLGVGRGGAGEKGGEGGWGDEERGGEGEWSDGGMGEKRARRGKDSRATSPQQPSVTLPSSTPALHSAHRAPPPSHLPRMLLAQLTAATAVGLLACHTDPPLPLLPADATPLLLTMLLRAAAALPCNPPSHSTLPPPAPFLPPPLSPLTHVLPPCPPPSPPSALLHSLNTRRQQVAREVLLLLARCGHGKQEREEGGDGEGEGARAVVGEVVRALRSTVGRVERAGWMQGLQQGQRTGGDGEREKEHRQGTHEQQEQERQWWRGEVRVVQQQAAVVEVLCEVAGTATGLQAAVAGGAVHAVSAVMAVTQREGSERLHGEQQNGEEVHGSGAVGWGTYRGRRESDEEERGEEGKSGDEGRVGEGERETVGAGGDESGGDWGALMMAVKGEEDTVEEDEQENDDEEREEGEIAEGGDGWSEESEESEEDETPLWQLWQMHIDGHVHGHVDGHGDIGRLAAMGSDDGESGSDTDMDEGEEGEEESEEEEDEEEDEEEEEEEEWGGEEAGETDGEGEEGGEEEGWGGQRGEAGRSQVQLRLLQTLFEGGLGHGAWASESGSEDEGTEESESEESESREGEGESESEESEESDEENEEHEEMEGDSEDEKGNGKSGEESERGGADLSEGEGRGMAGEGSGAGEHCASAAVDDRRGSGEDAVDMEMGGVGGRGIHGRWWAGGVDEERKAVESRIDGSDGADGAIAVNSAAVVAAAQGVEREGEAIGRGDGGKGQRCVEDEHGVRSCGARCSVVAVREGERGENGQVMKRQGGAKRKAEEEEGVGCEGCKSAAVAVCRERGKDTSVEGEERFGGNIRGNGRGLEDACGGEGAAAAAASASQAGAEQGGSEKQGAWRAEEVDALREEGRREQSLLWRRCLHLLALLSSDWTACSHVVHAGLLPALLQAIARHPWQRHPEVGAEGTEGTVLGRGGKGAAAVEVVSNVVRVPWLRHTAAEAGALAVMQRAARLMQARGRMVHAEVRRHAVQAMMRLCDVKYAVHG
ncbi:unnamed protein product [Closterium sp. Yama58-4]|nr:unnamed protein product [Closterium sp. Yama58-4]